MLGQNATLLDQNILGVELVEAVCALSSGGIAVATETDGVHVWARPKRMLKEAPLWGNENITNVKLHGPVKGREALLEVFRIESGAGEDSCGLHDSVSSNVKCESAMSFVTVLVDWRARRLIFMAVC